MTISQKLPLPHMTALSRFEQTPFPPEASYDIWTLPFIYRF